jgi:small Trp-rich protein
MYLLGLGIVLLLLRWAELGPFATWNWWVVLSPFGLAMLWWAWADASGYTKRKAMERDAARKASRVERQRDALGLGPRKRR